MLSSARLLSVHELGDRDIRSPVWNSSSKACCLLWLTRSLRRYGFGVDGEGERR
jgi:hypothetical protein